MCLKKKRGYTKKTAFVIGSEFDKTKLSSTKGPGSEISNVDSLVKPASELSNMGSEMGSGSRNRKGEELGDELIGQTETGIIYNTLISLLRTSLYLSTSSKIINAMILKLLDVYLSIDFKTIS